MRLSKAQIQQITDDLRLCPKTFGYAQPQWNGNSLSRHLASRYQLNYSPRQCRRLINKSPDRIAVTGVSAPSPAQPVTRVEARPWSGFSDTYRQEKTLQRLRQLSLSGLPLKSFASSLFELMTSATNSGEAAQTICIGDPLNHQWIFRDLETAEWTLAHPAQHASANSDDSSVSGMLIPASKLLTIIEPTLMPGQFMAPRFHESPAYDEMWRHHGVYSGTMNFLRSNGKLIGLAPVWKSRKEKPFTQSDIAFLDRAMPLITHGILMSHAFQLDPSFTAETTPTDKGLGVVTSDLRGRIVAIDQRARALFYQTAILDGRPLDAFSSSNLRAGLEYVSSVIQQTFGSDGGIRSSQLRVPAARVWWHRAGCIFLLRAVLSERLGRSPLVTILVEERELFSIKQRRWAIKYGMSPRESEIFHLAKAGMPRKDIATKLDISPNTVKTYLKLAALKIAEMDAQVTIPRA